MTILTERRVRVLSGAPSLPLRALPVTTFALDAATIFCATVLAALGRQRLDLFEPGGIVAEQLGWLWPMLIVAWLAAIGLAGGYRANVFGAGPDEFKRVTHASLLMAGSVGVLCYLAEFPLSRGFFLLAFAIGVPSLILGRLLLRRAVHQARIRGSLLNRVLIAGSPGHIDEVAGVLSRERWLGYHVIGALTPPSFPGTETPSGIPVIGSTDEIKWPVTASRANVVFFAGGAVDSAHDLRRIAWDLEKEDVQVVVAPSVTDVSNDRVRIRPVGGLPLIHVDAPRATEASRWGKRLFDIVGSAALLALFSPIFLIAAVWVRLHDGGPVLFRQVRIGKDGAQFSCLKFRSMVVDAEARLADLHAEHGYENGLFKLKDDPRITKPGAWLRKHSFDELPQLVNVLRGEMSLVGPRPPLPIEVARYERDAERRLDIRPGVTGLWQVSGRSDLSWEETIRLDLYYVDNWSMLQDVNILLKTLGAVARPTGAY
jgi:exopolysaccharide biosynthesis polyprenyl glycosylphosphotransferase